MSTPVGLFSPIATLLRSYGPQTALTIAPFRGLTT